MHVEQLFCSAFWPQIGKKYYKNRPSVTKDCKPSRLKFGFQVQVPKAVTKLALPAYNSLICSKLSDDGVSRLRFMVTVRQRKVWRYAGCRRTLPWVVKNI